MWNSDDNSELVFSTDTGRQNCSKCGKKINKCRCAEKVELPPGDGIARIKREAKGRKGKEVTTISGIELEAKELKKLASDLKKRCGTGGSLKNGVIEIQGDVREIMLTELQKRGFKAKLAGG